MQTRHLVVTARPYSETTKPAEGVHTHAVAAGDTLFLVTADGPDAAAVLDALDPLDIEPLRDRIGTLLHRGNATLADMAKRDGAAS
ncbi:hypothetical protein KPL78_12395 [Roseomonas sp. HJA6]|uniref:Uncharacterized protein n=1 Tax=Roseomonas alba TaxID=2846776 RepID=A0ABS7A8L8_9PROT|nr:hypothetical protein [Neoroseomonas alba]MBW6398656.1 hypothetical protein [Neoroseomonas alba]